MGAASPSSAAIRATAQPWFPSVAVTRVTGAEPSRNSVRLVAGVSKPLRWLNARFTAQDAPRILKAGNPRRLDSSLTSTAPTPGSSASSGSSTSGVGRYPGIEVWNSLALPRTYAEVQLRGPSRAAHRTLACRPGYGFNPL